MSQVLSCAEFIDFIHVCYIALLLLGEKELEDEGDESRLEEKGKQFTDATT